MGKDHFREHMKAYVEGQIQASFDTLNQKLLSIWMARFYADRVIRPLNPGLGQPEILYQALWESSYTTV
jgi:hypothetical protein